MSLTDDDDMARTEAAVAEAAMADGVIRRTSSRQTILMAEIRIIMTPALLARVIVVVVVLTALLFCRRCLMMRRKPGRIDLWDE